VLVVVLVAATKHPAAKINQKLECWRHEAWGAVLGASHCWKPFWSCPFWHVLLRIRGQPHIQKGGPEREPRGRKAAKQRQTKAHEANSTGKTRQSVDSRRGAGEFVVLLAGEGAGLAVSGRAAERGCVLGDAAAAGGASLGRAAEDTVGAQPETTTKRG
jgi:hypothetical protein